MVSATAMRPTKDDSNASVQAFSAAPRWSRDFVTFSSILRNRTTARVDAACDYDVPANDWRADAVLCVAVADSLAAVSVDWVGAVADDDGDDDEGFAFVVRCCCSATAVAFGKDSWRHPDRTNPH